MRIVILICCILALAMLALIGLSYTQGFAAEVSVTGIDNGVTIQNVGGTPCLVIVNSLEGEEQFKLAVGANVTLATVSKITAPFNVGAFGGPIVLLDLVRLPKPVGGWPGFNNKLSSNLTDP